MDTDSRYLALAEENLYDCIKPDKRAAWEKMRESDCRDSFKADAKSNLFPRTCCSTHLKHDKREPGLLKKNLDVQKCYVCVARHIAAMTTSPISSNLAVKG